MWRRPGESAKPELAGEDPYADQVPLARSVPLWAGISPKGCCEIIFHKTKKLDTQEWIGYLKGGALTKAVQKLKPSRGRCPWTLLCDGESFLRAKAAKKIYETKNIKLLQIPAKSPELNPIESFWGWLRQQLRLRDLQDLRAGRPALGKTAYKIRVKNLLRTKKAQKVAKKTNQELQSCLQGGLEEEGLMKRGIAAKVDPGVETLAALKDEVVVGGVETRDGPRDDDVKFEGWPPMLLLDTFGDGTRGWSPSRGNTSFRAPDDHLEMTS